jgi:hypothetical protein
VLLVHAAIGMAVAPAQLRWSATTRPGRRRVPATVGIVVGLVLVVAMTRPGSEDVALEAGSLGADALTLIVAVLALLGAGVGISALARRGST